MITLVVNPRLVNQQVGCEEVNQLPVDQQVGCEEVTSADVQLLFAMALI